MLRPIAVVLAFALVLGSAAAGRAEPIVLRMAAIAPPGTAWAHELQTFARDLENESRGRVRMKWYLGGIAGDETTALARVHRGQLDGLAGAGFCNRIAPSMGLLRVAGLFASRDEVAYVLGRLKPLFDDEARSAGFANIADSVFGADILFTRQPVQTSAQIGALRWWMWSESPVWLQMMAALRWRAVATPLEDLPATYQRGEVDGFIAPPGAALAYQWSTLATRFVPLEMAWLPGCLMIANAAMDPLSIDDQRAIRSAAAKFRARWNDTTTQLDDALVHGLLQKQGLQRIEPTAQLRAAFMETTRRARAQIDESVVPHAALAQAELLLREYRAAHGSIGP